MRDGRANSSATVRGENMKKDKNVIIYATTNCPKCQALKAAMPPLSFKTVDMSTTEALTELRINGVFTLSAPVLQIEDNFYTVEDLFEGNKLKTEKVNGLVG